MTIGKCLALARSEGLRYAGVEYGSECWVGNTLHSPSQAPDRDCYMVCSGNSSEICGAGNRVQVYQDQSWTAPSLAALITAAQAYNETMLLYRNLMQNYSDTMTEWTSAQNQNSSQRREEQSSSALRQRFTATINGIRDQAPEEFELRTLCRTRATCQLVSNQTQKPEQVPSELLCWQENKKISL